MDVKGRQGAEAQTWAQAWEHDLAEMRARLDRLAEELAEVRRNYPPGGSASN
jgi:hypothetical protein